MSRTAPASGVVIAIALALMASSCRSSAPEKETSGTEPGPPGPAISVAWTDTDLEKNASRIGYGPKPKDILARGSDGALVFTPETARDHVATVFTALPGYDGDRSLDVVLDVKVPGGETCAANLQDQGYNVLASVPCRAVGEQRATVKLPRSVNGVRVYFLSATRQPIRLPAQVHVTEHR